MTKSIFGLRYKQPPRLKGLKTPPHSGGKGAASNAAVLTPLTPLSTARLGDAASVGSMSSVSSLGSGGISATTPAIRLRRRGVDSVLPESNGSFGVDVYSKMHAADDAFSLSCVTGELVSASKWLAPAELGQVTKDRKTKVQLVQPFTERSLMHSDFEPRVDAESFRILRQLAHREPDKLAVLATASTVMALRVPSRATTIKIPRLDQVPLPALPVVGVAPSSPSLSCALHACLHETSNRCGHRTPCLGRSVTCIKTRQSTCKQSPSSSPRWCGTTWR